MEIKIEAQELINLKKHLELKDSEIKSLKSKLSELDENELNKKAKKYAFKLLDLYLSKVFSDLGFEKRCFIDISGTHFELNSINNKWWEDENIEFKISADVSNNFRKAFLSFGLKTDVKN